ncbi:hypothetical protein ACVWWN_006852 [Mycobacterium sp. URHB0021]
MLWAHGHRSDWDFFAAQAGDARWNYESVLRIYHRIEDWHGAPNPEYRGSGGLLFVQPAPDAHPIAPAMIDGACSAGIPAFDNPNGRMMEGSGGSSIADIRARGGYRQCVYRSYVFPFGAAEPDRSHRRAGARLTLDGSKATGVEFAHNGTLHRVGAANEVVLSLVRSTHPRCSCNRVSVTRPKFSGMASSWSSICPVWAETCKTMSASTACGSTNVLCRRATPRSRRVFLDQRPRDGLPRHTDVSGRVFQVIQRREHQPLQSAGGGMEPLRWSHSAEKPRRNPVDRSPPHSISARSTPTRCPTPTTSRPRSRASNCIGRSVTRPRCGRSPSAKSCRAI